MSDTPRTDEFVLQLPHEARDQRLERFARTLERENAALRAEVERLAKERDAAIESEMDKLLAMPDERIQAALRLEGRDPKDAATIAEQAAELAMLTVDRNARIERIDELLQRAEAAESALSDLRAKGNEGGRSSG